MALDLTAEQKETGKKNFAAASEDLNRRGFMKTFAAGAAAVPISAAAFYGYQSIGGRPVRAALIGGGDEGGVLVGEHNPEFLEIVAVADIRPYNQKRIFAGEGGGSPRLGLNRIYGKESAKKIKTYGDYKELLDPAVIKQLNLEAVVIALPLHLHAPCAIDCMKAGLHVLCEKLMARTIGQCKDMIRSAKDNKKVLSIGHQRHYSLLYAQALEVIQSGVLGDVKHIRALWHRNNSWPFDPVVAAAKGKIATGKDIDGNDLPQPALRDGWFPAVYEEDFAKFAKDPEALKKSGFKSIHELVRWRLSNRTGGGLMAELGSHQLDAASIFLGKVKPLAVTGVGGKFFYGMNKNDRSSDDHVFVTFEFPGKNHPQGPNKGSDPSDVVVVTYSSINTNGFENYGECLMGSRGTMIVEQESSVYLFKERDAAKKADADPKSMKVEVTAAGGGKPAMESAGTWTLGGAGGGVSKGTSTEKVSRGYREEMEHFAYCIRNWDPNVNYDKDEKGEMKQKKLLPRCHGEAAMADAIIALTANLAMKRQQRIAFDPKWFDGAAAEVPETAQDIKDIDNS